MAERTESCPARQEQVAAMDLAQMAGQAAVAGMAPAPAQPMLPLRPPARHVPLPMPERPLWRSVGPLTDGVFGRQVV